MGFGALRALTLELNQEFHGVDITIQPDGLTIPTAIVTRGIWLTNETPDVMSGVSRGGRDAFGNWRDVRRVLAIPRAALDSVPTHIVIVAPEQDGGDPKRWVVDGVDDKRADHTRVVLVPEPTYP
jgi:hypothetical protein